MKILAIRGANLASLEGDFELVLDQGPLSEEGVFAICGPTGAGKSTLLDAMCLALFETAPRLEGQGRVRVGRAGDDRDRITSSDPRSILRMGAGSGFAEVDFEGVDALRYRARWDVRRSRNRPEGKLQASALSLTALDADERWSGRKTDVKEEIARRLGLSFDQFKRSVLLAQGDFAAFLNADAKDRADLLERMTGTAIYGAISIEAHARASRERARMDNHFVQLQAVPVLAPDERVRHVARAEELTLQVQRDELARSDAEAAVRWHHLRDGLLAEERDVAAQRAKIAEQLEVWEPRRAELSAAELVRSLRPLFSVASDAEKVSEARVAALGAAREAARVAEEEAAVASDARGLADRAREAERRNAEATSATVVRARVLDAEIEASAGVTAASLATRTEAGIAVAAGVKHDAALEARAKKLANEIGALERWLEERVATAALLREWPRVRVQLERWLEVRAEEAEASSSWQRAKVRLDAAGLAETSAVSRLALLERARRELEQRVTALRTELANAPTGALDGQTEEWGARRASLELLVGVVDQAHEAQGQQRRHLERCESARAAAARFEATADEHTRAGELTKARLEEAEAQRDRVRAQLHLATHRAELVDGEPCPLCGSEDHPMANDTPGLDAILADVDERLGALRDALRSADAQRVAGRKEAEGRRTAARDAAGEADEWSTKLDAARVRYREIASELSCGEIDSPSDWPAELGGAASLVGGPLFSSVDDSTGGDLLPVMAREALDAALAEAAEKLVELRLTREARRALERELDGLRGQSRGALADTDAARTARERATRELEAAVHAEEVARESHRRVERERATLDAALEPHLAPYHTEVSQSLSVARSGVSPQAGLELGVASLVHAGGGDRVRARAAGDWKVVAAEDPAIFVRRVAAGVDVREAEAGKLARLKSELNELSPERARLEERRVAATAALEVAVLAYESAQKNEAEARGRRATLLHGSADDAEHRAKKALAATDARAEKAAERHAETTKVDVRSRAHRERAAAALAEAVVAQKDAVEALDAALSEDPVLEGEKLDRERALALLRIAPTELESWRENLDRLDRERGDAEAVHAERKRKREAHESADPPSTDHDASRVLVTEATARLASTRELLHAVRARLEQDDTHRERSETLFAELDRMRQQLGVWEVLADLIGSASGNKLRVFAQSLTLDLLLEHANHHLRELARRYALQRVPGESLAIQVVDREMGDEVRSVSTLSGGESFLVALGMALGLASLSSQQARVDSLFIDEGFGSLDPGSLEQVLATLDELHSQGRQIGLISHVPAVAERFDTRVEVIPAGPARSRVELVGERR